MKMIPRRILACLAAVLLLVGCESTLHRDAVTVMRWDAGRSTILDAATVPEGMALLRKTAVRTGIEIYDPTGRQLAQCMRNYPVVFIYAPFNRSVVYFVEEISFMKRLVWEWRYPAEPVQISDLANWYDLILDPNGDLLAFDSLFQTRDVRPSGCRIFNLTRKTELVVDMDNCQRPFGTWLPLCVGPIDRRVRLIEGNAYRELGAVINLAVPPVVSQNRNRAAWYGPQVSGTGLFVIDTTGTVSPFTEELLQRPVGLTDRFNRIVPAAERPVGFVGDDLAVAYQDALTLRWMLRRFSLPDLKATSEVPIPEGVVPSQFLGDLSGEFVGFPTAQGSMLLHLTDNFARFFPGTPLSAWYFSPDGKRLFLLAQDSLQVIEL